MDEKDMKRFKELENKIDENTITKAEMEERDMLWSALEMEEENNRINSYQFGY